MAGIPKYERRVQRQLPGVIEVARPDTSGIVQLGRGIQQLGGVMFDIALREREKADSAAVQRAYTKAAQASLDQTAAFSQLRGEAAIKGAEQAIEQYTQNLDDINADLGNDRQRNKFAQIKDREALSFRRSIQQHTLGEQEALFDETNKATQAIADEKGLRAAAEPDLDLRYFGMNEALGEKKAAIAARAEREGWSKEVLEAEMLIATTDYHKGVIEAMSDQDNPGDARYWLDSHKEEIESNTLRDLSELIDGADLRGDIHKISDALIDRFRTGKFDMDFNGAMAEARKITEWKKREGVEAELREHLSDLNYARRAHDDPLLDKVENKILTGMFRKNRDRDFDKLTLDGKNRALKMLKSHRNKGTERQKRIDDLQMLKFVLMEPDDMRNVDILKVFGDASIPTLIKMRKTQAKLIKEGTLQRTEFKGLVEREADKRMYKKNHQDWNTFVGGLMNRYDEEGTKPDPEQLKQWIKDASLSYVYDTWIGKKVKQAHQLTPEQLAGEDILGLAVTDEEKEAMILNFEKENKRPPNSDEEEVMVKNRERQHEREWELVKQGIEFRTLRWPYAPVEVKSREEIPDEQRNEIMKIWEARKKTAEGFVPFPPKGYLVEAYNMLQRRGPVE